LVVVPVVEPELAGTPQPETPPTVPPALAGTPSVVPSEPPEPTMIQPEIPEMPPETLPATGALRYIYEEGRTFLV
jgi:hypothetical protein